MNTTQVIRAHMVVMAAATGSTVRAAIDGEQHGPGVARSITDEHGASFRGSDIRDACLRVTTGVCDEYWPIRPLVDGDPASNVIVAE